MSRSASEESFEEGGSLVPPAAAAAAAASAGASAFGPSDWPYPPQPKETGNSGLAAVAYKLAPENFEIILASCIGGGQQGDIYEAILRNKTTREEHQCVVKKLRDRHSGDRNVLPKEFFFHQLAAAKIRSSVDSGILRIIGVMPYADEKGSCSFAILPHCEFMFSDVLNKLRRSENGAVENLALNAAVIMDFLKSSTSALTELSRSSNEDERIVHHDIKPDNIASRKSGERRGLVLIDFGSAETHKEMSEAASGEFKGSPTYMAPETLTSDRAGIPPQAADIYSVGIIGCKMFGIEFDFEKAAKSVGANQAMVMLFSKSGKYNELLKAAEPCDATKVAAKQIELQKKIKESTDFWDCSKNLFKAMCEVLPVNRPTLETLAVAIEHLKSIQPPVNEVVLNAFYDQVAVAVVIEREEKRRQQQEFFRQPGGEASDQVTRNASGVSLSPCNRALDEVSEVPPQVEGAPAARRGSPLGPQSLFGGYTAAEVGSLAKPLAIGDQQDVAEAFAKFDRLAG